MNYFANSYEEASSLSFLVEKMNIPFIKIAIFNPIKLNYLIFIKLFMTQKVKFWPISIFQKCFKIK